MNKKQSLLSRIMNPKYIMVYATVIIFLIIYAYGAIRYGSIGFTTLRTFVNFFSDNAYYGISGMIYSSRIMSNDSNNAGINYETDAILSVVIGGTSMTGGKFSLAGTIVGSIIIRTIVTFVYYFGVSPDSTMAFKAMIIAVIIVLQSEPVRNWMAKRSMARSQAKAMARGGVQ